MGQLMHDVLRIVASLPQNIECNSFREISDRMQLYCNSHYTGGYS